MFRGHSQDVRATAPSICFVTCAGAGVSDTVSALTSSGVRAHVLLCPAEDGPTSVRDELRRLTAQGIAATSLLDVPLAATITLDGPNCFAVPYTGDLIRHAL